MHSTAPVMISFAAPGAVAARRARPDASAANTPSMAMRDAERLAHRQRFDAEQRADDHGLQRQRRQREAGARRRRVADGDVVEDEEQSEEADAQARRRAASRCAAASVARSSSVTGSTTQKADAPAQNRERQRIGIADQIARDRRGRAAEAARHDRDQNAEPLAQPCLLSCAAAYASISIGCCNYLAGSIMVQQQTFAAQAALVAAAPRLVAARTRLDAPASRSAT